MRGRVHLSAGDLIWQHSEWPLRPQEAHNPAALKLELSTGRHVLTCWSRICASATHKRLRAGDPTKYCKANGREHYMLPRSTPSVREEHDTCLRNARLPHLCCGCEACARVYTCLRGAIMSFYAGLHSKQGIKALGHLFPYRGRNAYL